MKSPCLQDALPPEVEVQFKKKAHTIFGAPETETLLVSGIDGIYIYIYIIIIYIYVYICIYIYIYCIYIYIYGNGSKPWHPNGTLSHSWWTDGYFPHGPRLRPCSEETTRSPWWGGYCLIICNIYIYVYTYRYIDITLILYTVDYYIDNV